MNQLATILTHYFGAIAGEAGFPWNWENAGEVEGAVERFENQIEALVQRRVDEELARRLPEAIEQVLAGRSPGGS